MPYYAHREGRPWSPKPDFVRSGVDAVRIARSEPQTPEAIRTYLEDVGASAIAAANQYTDPETAAVAYEEMTGRVLEDLRLGLPLDMAVTHQQYRELGYRNIGFSQPLDGSEVAVHFS